MEQKHPNFNFFWSIVLITIYLVVIKTKKKGEGCRLSKQQSVPHASGLAAQLSSVAKE